MTALNGGSSTGPRCLSCAFTLLTSATLIINREGGVGIWGWGASEVWVDHGVVKLRAIIGVMVSFCWWLPESVLLGS